jgi:2-polyprenyl-6-methoxyphenol hydroxylase-like FAD-dependent oxidoreductase
MAAGSDQEAHAVTPPPTDTDVLIVGAGPTGLMAAIGLARRGIRARIIDTLPAPAAWSKALAIQPRTQEILDTLGLIERFEAAGTPMHGMTVYLDGHRVTTVRFGHVRTPYPHLLSVPQNVTESLLTDHLSELGVTVERGMELARFELDADGVTATLTRRDGPGEQVRAGWLLGCDGAHSTVRHQLGLTFEGDTVPRLWALADVRLEWPEPNTDADLFTRGAEALLVFPMPGGRARVMASVPDAAAAGQPAAPTLAQVQGWLDAGAMRVGRIFLAGDAVHIHSPAGGQGMNTGLQDVHNLTWKLALVLEGRAAPVLLDTYEDERLPVDRAVVRFTSRLFALARLEKPWQMAARVTGLRIAGAVSRVWGGGAALLGQLTIRYQPGLAVVDDLPPRFGRPAMGVRAGMRAPDADGLVLPDGSDGRLFDLLRGTGFVALVLPGRYADPADWEAARDQAAALAGRPDGLVSAYLVGPREPLQPRHHAWGVVADLDRGLRRQYGGPEGRTYLIRPDGVVGYRGPIGGGAGAYLDWLLSGGRAEALTPAR